MSASPGAAASRAAAGFGLSGLAVGVSGGGPTVTAEVRAVARTDVPLIGALLPDIGLRAAVTMAREPP